MASGNRQDPEDSQEDDHFVTHIKPLTVKDVHDTLNSEGYPMTWTEFQLKYLPKSPQSLDIVTNFRKLVSESSCDCLCHCEDFVALNYPFHTNRIKLQLILEIRRRSNQASEIHIDEFQKQFEEIATDHEIEQTRLKCSNFQEYLAKFQSIFSVSQSGFVKQNIRSLRFNSFFKFEKKKAASSSIIHKLLYFVKISGKFCTLRHACRFLQTHVVSSKEKSLLDTPEKTLSFVKNCDVLVMKNGFLFIKKGNISDDVKSKKEDKCTGQSKKALAASHIKTMEVILQRRDLPLSWEDVIEEYSLTGDYDFAECWVKELRERVLPMTPSHSFIFAEDFISLDNPLHKGHLKMCLLLQWNAKRELSSTLELLRQQMNEIATNSEREVVGGEEESLRSKFEDLEGILDVTWIPDKMSPCILLPGENMISFSGFFHCGEHGPSDCMPCRLVYFVNMCGGSCSFVMAFNFVKMFMVAEGQFTGDKMDVVSFLQFCDSVTISSDGETVSLFDSTSQAQLTKKKKTCDSSTALLEVLAQNKQQKASTCRALSLPSEEKKNAVTMDTRDRKKHIIFVQCVESKKSIKGILQKVQGSGKRMHVSMAMHQNALAVIVAGGPAFVLPRSKTQDNFEEKKKVMAEILTKPMISRMVLDCGKFADSLLNLFDIQLEGHLHDTKVGLHLLLQHQQLTVCSQENSSDLEDLCRYLDVPGPGDIIVEVSNSDSLKGGPKKELPNKLKLSAIQAAVSEAYVQSPTLLSKLDSLMGSLHLRKQYQQTCKSVLEEVYCRHGLADNSLQQPLPDEFPTVEEFRIDDSSYALANSQTPPVTSEQERALEDAVFKQEDKRLQNGISFDQQELNGDLGDWFLPDDGAATVHNLDQQELNGDLGDWFLPDDGAAAVHNLDQQELNGDLGDWFLPNDGAATVHNPLLEENKPQIKTLCQDGHGRIIKVPVEESNSYNTNLTSLTQEMMVFYQEEAKKEVIKLLNLLGGDVWGTLVTMLQTNSLNYLEMTEIVLDLGRKAQARFSTRSPDGMPITIPASQEAISRHYLEDVEKNEEFTGFDDENRAGVEGTLHSVSGVRNRKGQLIGLTVHVNFPWLGCADMLQDVAFSGKSIVVLGHLGVGKTTLLRELARCLSDHAKKRVVVIDTYNKIAGDSDISHYSIGGARRVQVESFATQYETMLEVSKNHNPEVMIVDEIESSHDADVISALCRKGIQFIAAARDKSVPTLLSNQNLFQLFSPYDNQMELPDWSESSRSSVGVPSMSKVKPSIQTVLLMVETDRWLLHDLCPKRVGQDICVPVEERMRVVSSQTSVPYKVQNIIIQEMLH